MLSDLDDIDTAVAGDEIYAFVKEAFPICRSITGDGVRQTLELLQRWIPLEVHEVPTGTQVFDWTVPREWNIRGAHVTSPSGRRTLDFKRNNLHVLGYSVPVHRALPLEELKKHLHWRTDKPDVIPYRTSYYEDRWGFCLTYHHFESLQEGEYEVHIDSTLEPGHLTYGELVIPGQSDDTVLISTHICHPSLANDNLSGVGTCAYLAKTLLAARRKNVDPRYTYRFLFVPGTIGSITWLARNEEAARRVRHGLVAANLGDGGKFHYKKSRQGDAEIDRVVVQVLKDAGGEFEVEDFVPFGYDERQYCSPAFNLAVGSLTRTPWGRYSEYHTSADNLDLVRPKHLGLSLRRYLEVLGVLEHNRRYRNLNPHCEPQLGSRGLYRTIGGSDDGREKELALLWVLNLSDGDHGLLEIAERSGMSFGRIVEAARALLDAELLAEKTTSDLETQYERGAPNPAIKASRQR